MIIATTLVPNGNGTSDGGALRVERILRKEILELCFERRIQFKSALIEGTSLVDDVGLDSLSFVDFGLRIESALGVTDFPLQDWVYEEAQRADAGYTFGSLLRFVRDRVPAIESPPP